MPANRIRVDHQNKCTVIKIPSGPTANDAVLHDEVAAIVLAFANEYVLSTKEYIEGGLCVIEVSGGGEEEAEKLKDLLAKSFEILGNPVVSKPRFVDVGGINFEV